MCLTQTLINNNKVLHWTLLFVMVMLSSFAAAQNPDLPEAEYPYKRDIEKGKYDKAADKILRHVSRDNESLEYHYAAYHLFSHPLYAGRNLDSAYTHLEKVRTIFSRAEQKYIERWARDSYSGALIDFGFRRIGEMALQEADSIHTPDAYQHFLNYFSLSPDDLRDQAIARRDTIEFAHAVNAGTIEMIQAFIIRRPSSLLTSDAMHLRDSMAFAEADHQHTTAAYEVFRTAYPRSYLFERATDSVYTIDYRDVRFHDAEQYYRSYASRYPQSPYVAQSLWYADSIEFHREVDSTNWYTYINYMDRHGRPSWQDTAISQLSRFALHNSHVQAAVAVANRSTPRNIYHAELAKFLHQKYIGTSIRNFPRFYRDFPDLMSVQQYYSDSLAYELNNNYHYHISDSCIRIIAPSHEAFIMLQQLLKDDIDHFRFTQALATMDRYSDHFVGSYEYKSLYTTLSTASQGFTKATALPASINTPKGDEYAPVISANGKTLYFAGKNRTDNIGGEDVFVAQRNGKSWTNARIEMDLSHTYGNEAPVSISSDGNTLILYQSGLLYQAEKSTNGWHIEKLSALVNNSSWKGDAMMASNGRVLIFAAYSHTHHELDSSLNLFVSVLDSGNHWSEPIELGITINTPFDERAPFLHPDMRTLYFASEGHGSMGQMDVYKTTRLDDTWTHWSQPINIGREVNTTGDDWGYQISTDGLECFFSRRESSQNIYSTTVPLHARPQNVTTVSGTILDRGGRPVSSTLIWEDPATGNILGQCHSDPTNGSYLIILPQGRQYSLYVQSNDYFPISQRIDLTDQEASSHITYNFNLTSYVQMTDDGISVTLNNVTFDVSNPEFNISSQAELRRLAKIIRDHNFLVEIACHLDGNVGDNDNLVLTQLRANGIRDYLILQGCRPSDISARGYGSDRPLSVSHKTSSKTSRPQSRRVEVTLSYNK